MKIRKEIPIEILEQYGYHYEENIVYPSYQKIKGYGNKIYVVEIVIQNRTIYINKSNIITEKNSKLIKDLIDHNLVEK